MILFVMALVLVAPLAAIVDVMVHRRAGDRRTASLGGAGAGALLANATLYARGVPAAAVALAVAGAAAAAYLGWRLRRRLFWVASGALVGGMGLALAWYGILLPVVNREADAALTVRQPAGMPVGTALVVVHPGSGFADDLGQAFAQRLVEQGWQVTTAAANDRAPGDVGGYGLVLVGGPTYNWGEASRPVARYIERAEGWDRTTIVGLTTGVGFAPDPDLADRVARVGGRLAAQRTVYSLAPNDELNGTDAHLAIVSGFADEAARLARP